MKSKQSLRIPIFSALGFVAAGMFGQIATAQESAEAQQSASPEAEEASEDRSRAFLSEQLSAQIEETVVLGKLQSAAGDIVLERMMSEAATDIIGAEQIGRIGDSNVATALRRVPGVTLVDDKFIYVRGLGERYSSSQLNGASVPTPDLTRSVLPLDIFPTSVVASLAVQKTYSSDMPAAFGGGNVDVRTTGIPDEFVFSVEVGTSYNTETSGNGLTARSSDDDWLGTDDGTRSLAATVEDALNTYAGSFAQSDIANQLIQDSGNTLDFATASTQAGDIIRNLALDMNRDLDVSEGDPGRDFSGAVTLGNNWLYGNGVEFGFLSGLSYGNSYVTRDTTSRDWDNPAQEFSLKTETTRQVNITGNVTVGLRLNEDNEVRTTSLFIRNTDDDVAQVNYFDSNAPLSDGAGNQEYDLIFEEREMIVNQINGEHVWSDVTRELVGLSDGLLSSLDGLELNWYYSDASATTDIPGDTNVQFQTLTDPDTGEVLSSVLALNESVVDYRYTDLEDDVESYGYDLKLPIYLDSFTVDLSGGWDYVRKARSYRQRDLNLGSADPDVAAFLSLSPSEYLSDDNILNADLGFALNVNTGSSRSYIAAVTNESVFGKVDLNWEETVRVILGARWESYNQVGLPWQPLNFQEQITTDPDELASAAFQDDSVYPSAAFVYMSPDFFAETYQLRFSYSETVVRPDLREITETSYQDPLNSEFLIFGNEDVIPSDVKNYDIRSEWFFSNGDNLTLSLFFKDIENPIEFFERPASDRKRAAQIQNAESGEVYGLEVEWLKDMSFAGDVFAPFFLQGNLTLAESEMVAGDDLPTPPTNATRTLSGASEYVVNLQLGFDSDDGFHAATLVYNVFGERLRAAGISGAPDTFEQPFNSLDLTYSYYPTNSTILKLKLKNLLGESVEWQENGVSTFEEDIGLSASVDFEWEF